MIFQNIQYVMQTVNEFERSCFNLSSIRQGNLNISTLPNLGQINSQKIILLKEESHFPAFRAQGWSLRKVLRPLNTEEQISLARNGLRFR